MKPKRCKCCKATFAPSRPMQAVCGIECGISIAQQKRALKQAKEQAAERKETRAKLEKLKTRGDHIKEAQNAFNKYVRLRDVGKGCISCGANCGTTAVGGDGDAGHFRSRGSAPHLRFDERNCHLQCKKCNRYLSGNVANYRIGLIERIGLDAVDELEADQEPRNHTIDDLKEIKARYTKLANELKKGSEKSAHTLFCVLRYDT